MARSYNDQLLYYKYLTRSITRLLVEELNNGEYENLQNPQNRSKNKGKVRFRIMARPPGVIEVGKRNLNLGYNEALLFIHGKPKESGGLDLKVENSRYRWAIGDFIGSDLLLETIDQPFIDFMRKSGKDMIGSGDYEQFVKSTMYIVNASINKYGLVKRKL